MKVLDKNNKEKNHLLEYDLQLAESKQEKCGLLIQENQLRKLLTPKKTGL
jgi:hypothetical protein